MVGKGALASQQKTCHKASTSSCVMCHLKRLCNLSCNMNTELLGISLSWSTLLGNCKDEEEGYVNVGHFGREIRKNTQLT